MLVNSFVIPALFYLHASEPNDESAANVNAAKMWREDRAAFDRTADSIVRKSLGLPPH